MIMRKLFTYTLSAILLLTASCSQEIDPVEQLQSGTITLSLRNAVPETRMAGVDDLNENLIESIHYFFYPKDGTDTNTEKEPVKWNVLTGLSSQTLHTFRVNVSEDMLKNDLFKYPYNECDVYVIVNLPEDIDVSKLTDRKLSTLKAIAVEADFVSSLKQESFVMEGLGVATIIDRKKILAAEGTIEVDRLAAKISVGVTVRESITTMDNQTSTNNQTWTSVPKDMVVEFVNGVSNTVLAGDPDKVSAFSYFTDANSSRTFSDADGDKIWTCAPFYSYPSKWDIGSDEEPYLRITLPWQTVIDTGEEGNDPPIIQTEKCIYKVILGGERLNRNTWNDLTIDIGILGNFENQEEVILPIENTNYFVADWSDGKAVESEILGGRYLVVDEESYKLYNETSLTIPFTTSHECEIINVSCKYPNYTSNPPTVNTVDTSQYSIVIENGKIKFTHAINNDFLSRDLDFTPFTVKFTIQHKDDSAFYREITIIQYPAIYVEGFDNTDNTNGGGNNDDYGFVWVNGYQGSSASSGVDTFCGSTGLSQSTADRRMFVFTITTTEGTDYIIGDPRDIEYTYTDASANWYTGPALYDGTSRRELKYYYGTTVANSKYTNATNSTGTIYANNVEASTAEPTFNMIAPKFRLASGYGAVSNPTTGANTLETLKKRCASYQEDGYPAGRWRLPTRAEFEFIFTQITYGNLPKVFVENTSYWCAHGLGTPSNGQVTMKYIGYNSSAAYTRCVYDEWYWENSESYRLGTENANGSFTPSDIFTWGDMPRSEFK